MKPFHQTQLLSWKKQKIHWWSLTSSDCISVPLWQIRIFGLFFMPNPDIWILSGFFFVQVRIGPYILFSNCKWHRRCRPTHENTNCSKNVNTITWWCNVFQTSDSLKVNDEDSLKSSEQCSDTRVCTQKKTQWVFFGYTHLKNPPPKNPHFYFNLILV